VIYYDFAFPWKEIRKPSTSFTIAFAKFIKANPRWLLMDKEPGFGRKHS